MARSKRKKVEILYLDGCPNHSATIETVHRVASELGIDAEILEVEVKTADDAERLRFLGSPSVLIDGVDIEPNARASRAYAFACRTYGAGAGAPPGEWIAAALQGEIRGSSTGGHLRGVAGSLPALGALLLPVGTCPACFPGYAGFLSSLGLGFMLYEEYLLPIAATLLVVALGTLLYRPRERHGFGPFLLGGAASAIALGGKFGLGSDALLYGGFGLLAVATAWNSWPKRPEDPRACDSCASNAA